MKTKQDIVENWLPRYTGVPLDGFGKHVLLTNFGGYLDLFARMTGAEVVGRDELHLAEPAERLQEQRLARLALGDADARADEIVFTRGTTEAITVTRSCCTRRKISAVSVLGASTTLPPT